MSIILKSNTINILGGMQGFKKFFTYGSPMTRLKLSSIQLGWQSGGVMLDVLNGASGSTAERYVIVNSSASDKRIYRIYNAGIRDSKVYISSDGGTYVFEVAGGCPSFYVYADFSKVSAVNGNEEISIDGLTETPVQTIFTHS